MKKILIPVLALFVIGATAFTLQKGEAYKTLEIGAKAPMLSHKMTSSLGNDITLNELKGDMGTIVMFSCNTCPFVIAWEDRYPDLAEKAQGLGVNMVLVNSNEAKRKGDDSMEEMKKHAKEKGYANIPYLVDENSDLANAFGGKSTPHVFLFDKDWKLVYEGAIDDNHKDAGAVENHYLENALKNLAAGKKIDPNNTKALGCSIKRVKS